MRAKTAKANQKMAGLIRLEWMGRVLVTAAAESAGISAGFKLGSPVDVD
jgi:hypothetical protein